MILKEAGCTLMLAGAKLVYPFSITRTYHSDDQEEKVMDEDLQEQACWLLLVFESGLSTRIVADMLPSNKLLLEKGGYPLPWPTTSVADSLSPVIQESSQIREKQRVALPAPDQLSLLASFHHE